MVAWKEQILSAQKGDEQALQRLVEENTGLVHAVVRRFFNRGVEAEDLFQIGMIGLIKAIKRFDVSMEVKFSTYAVPMIIGEIKRFLRDDGMIKVSRTIRENAGKIAKCKEFMTQEMGREPRTGEIAKKLGMNMEEVNLALEAFFEVESIYRSVNHDGEEENYLLDQIRDVSQEDKIFDTLFLSWGMDQLEEKERQLIYMRYFEDMTQSQVAKKMNMSQVSVSRLEKKILKSLRQRLE